MSTPLLLDGVSGTGADPMSFLGVGVGQVWSLTGFPTLIRGSACCLPNILKPDDAAGNVTSHCDTDWWVVVSHGSWVTGHGS